MERTLGDSGVTLAAVRERRIHLSAVAADFDSSRAIGRINAWVSGEIDFQVLRRETGEDVLIKHAKVSKMDGPDLEGAYADFLRLMLNPDSGASIDAGKQLQDDSLNNT
jgi:hypothetical protein